jgi:hypothetical protein
VSLLDGITVLCEGIDQGLDVRILELARAELQPQLPIAARVTLRPAGPKNELPSAIQWHRALRNTSRVYALRDRDFLPSALLESRRRQASSHDQRVAFPLRRHCIESYLVDPAFVAAALSLDKLPDVEAIAQRRLWLDVSRAVLEEAAYHARERRPRIRAAWPTSEEEAREAVRASMSAGAADVSAGATVEQVVGRVAFFAEDFNRDVVWTRVDGKELLRVLETTLQGVLPGGGIIRGLSRHAETRGAPGALVDELRELLSSLPP